MDYVEVRYAGGSELYESFSGETERPEPREVIFADGAGKAQARRWTNRQSRQSAVRDETIDVLILAEALHASAQEDSASGSRAQFMYPRPRAYSRSPMRIVVAQMQVEREIAKNRETICSLLQRARSEDWVVFPEGALTGYFPDETDYLAGTEPEDVEAALAGLRAVIARRRCHCLVGTARFIAGEWRNSAALISSAGEVRWYDKHTLSSLDSRHFAAGEELSVYALDGVKAGVQICWELLFPWQWTQLKRDGAQVVFRVNNAVKPEDAFWERPAHTRV